MYPDLWIQCDRLCGEGQRHRKVTCFRTVDGVIEALDDTECSDPAPERSMSCSSRPCDGVDWITSEWSGVSYQLNEFLLSRNLRDYQIHELFVSVKTSVD